MQRLHRGVCAEDIKSGAGVALGALLTCGACRAGFALWALLALCSCGAALSLRALRAFRACRAALSLRALGAFRACRALIALCSGGALLSGGAFRALWACRARGAGVAGLALGVYAAVLVLVFFKIPYIPVAIIADIRRFYRSGLGLFRGLYHVLRPVRRRRWRHGARAAYGLLDVCGYDVHFADGLSVQQAQLDLPHSGHGGIRSVRSPLDRGGRAAHDYRPHLAVRALVYNGYGAVRVLLQPRGHVKFVCAIGVLAHPPNDNLPGEYAGARGITLHFSAPPPVVLCGFPYPAAFYVYSVRQPTTRRAHGHSSRFQPLPCPSLCCGCIQ